MCSIAYELISLISRKQITKEQYVPEQMMGLHFVWPRYMDLHINEVKLF